MPKPRRAPPPRRQRRTSEEARAAILDAAERLLVETGPGAIRLQQVAADVGVSHPTVLHHFGSREALVEAVVTRTIETLQAEVLAAIQRAPADEDEVFTLLERVFTVLGTRGHARALAWCALAGAAAPSGMGLLHIAEVTHAQRKQIRGADTPSFDDTRFTILLALFAVFSQSILWPLLSRGAGIGDDPKQAARFRRWLARVVKTHLRTGSEPP